MRIEEVLRMALLHDMAELLTFDISKGHLANLGGRGEQIKTELETAAWRRVSAKIDDLDLRRKYMRVQLQYNECKTLESRIVHEADALDILLAILEYGRRGYPLSMFSDIWAATSHKLRDTKIPSVRRIHNSILKKARHAR